MLRLELDNFFKTIGLRAKARWQKLGASLPAYLKKIEARGQGFYRAFDDAEELKNILAFARDQRGRYRSIVVLGIGGSALGTLCLAQGLRHLFAHELPGSGPKLYVLDNIDPALIREVENVIDFKTTLCVVVTKSGSTPETISQYFYFREKFNKKKLALASHFVFITGDHPSFLRQVAAEQGITTFRVPAAVGGRYSVLTAVGLVPAALLGIDIKKLLAGAKKMRDAFLSSDFKSNLPFQLAAAQYLAARSGRGIHVLMPYAQKLIRFADWYRQLLAESLGKTLDNRGKTVHAGITPVTALGATDQHSQAQLYNEGPDDKLIMFIRANTLGPELPIPAADHPEPSVAFLKNTSFNKLLAVELQGTAAALTKNGRPNFTIAIQAVDEFHLGALIMLFQGVTAFLGEFFNINAFDQPGVELSKQLTKQLLAPRR